MLQAYNSATPSKKTKFTRNNSVRLTPKKALIQARDLTIGQNTHRRDQNAKKEM